MFLYFVNVGVDRVNACVVDVLITCYFIKTVCMYETVSVYIGLLLLYYRNLNVNYSNAC